MLLATDHAVELRAAYRAASVAELKVWILHGGRSTVAEALMEMDR